MNNFRSWNFWATYICSVGGEMCLRFGKCLLKLLKDTQFGHWGILLKLKFYVKSNKKKTSEFWILRVLLISSNEIPKWQFLKLEIHQNWFHVNLSFSKILQFPDCVPLGNFTKHFPNLGIFLLNLALHPHTPFKGTYSISKPFFHVKNCLLTVRMVNTLYCQLHPPLVLFDVWNQLLFW